MNFLTLPKGCMVKLPLKLIFVWVVILLAIYLFIVKQQTPPSIITTSKTVPHMFDAIVYIAMSKIASDPIVDYSIASLRLLGNWGGNVYVITDHPSCFDSVVNKYNVKVLSTPSVNSLIEIKAMKSKLFDYLPENIKGVLYLDVDIVIRQSLELFYKDISDIVAPKLHVPMTGLNTTGHIEVSNTFDYAAFLDAKGHFVGFCSGCEKWHTGIMYVRRNYGSNCLKEWEKILLSGKFDTDQESMDEAEKNGHCKHATALPSKHLIFAKDYIGMIFTTGQTFIHFTSAARLGTQDYFYRSIIVPHLRRSLNPPLHPSILKHDKVCATR